MLQLINVPQINSHIANHRVQGTIGSAFVRMVIQLWPRYTHWNYPDCVDQTETELRIILYHAICDEYHSIYIFSFTKLRYKPRKLLIKLLKDLMQVYIKWWKCWCSWMRGSVRTALEVIKLLGKCRCVHICIALTAGCLSCLQVISTSGWRTCGVRQSSTFCLPLVPVRR